MLLTLFTFTTPLGNQEKGEDEDFQPIPHDELTQNNEKEVDKTVALLPKTSEDSEVEIYPMTGEKLFFLAALMMATCYYAMMLTNWGGFVSK